MPEARPAAWNVAVPEAPDDAPTRQQERAGDGGDREQLHERGQRGERSAGHVGHDDPLTASRCSPSCSVMAPVMSPAAVASVAAGLSSRAGAGRVDPQLERRRRGDDAGGGRGQRHRGVEAGAARRDGELEGAGEGGGEQPAGAAERRRRPGAAGDPQDGAGRVVSADERQVDVR